jgi:hypothetical protein
MLLHYAAIVYESQSSLSHATPCQEKPDSANASNRILLKTVSLRSLKGGVFCPGKEMNGLSGSLQE